MTEDAVAESTLNGKLGETTHGNGLIQPSIEDPVPPITMTVEEEGWVQEFLALSTIVASKQEAQGL